MLQTRIHGLGGQGVVLSAHLLGKAALHSGLWAHSFPFFTTAMRGGNVTAFARIDEAPIDQRCFVYTPDALIVFHEGLLSIDEVIDGVNLQGSIVVNTEQPWLDAPAGFEGEMVFLNARRIAERTIGRPILSTVMAGAAAGVLNVIPLDALIAAIEESFADRLVRMNVEAAEEGFRCARSAQ